MNHKMGLEMDEMDEMDLKRDPRAAAAMRATASAAMVNRTHRVVHERARTMQERRMTFRSLWIPLIVSGGLLSVIVSAIWSILEQDELIPTGVPDANQQLLVLMMWCLPVTVLLGVVLFHRGSTKTDGGRAG